VNCEEGESRENMRESVDEGESGEKEQGIDSLSALTSQFQVFTIYDFTFPFLTILTLSPSFLHSFFPQFTLPLSPNSSQFPPPPHNFHFYTLPFNLPSK